MKTFTYVLSVIAAIFAVYNVTKIDFNNPFGSESIVAIITAFAGFCVILLLSILRISKKIEWLSKQPRSKTTRHL